MSMPKSSVMLLLTWLLASASSQASHCLATPASTAPNTLSPSTAVVSSVMLIDKPRYQQQLEGFWLGLSIGNWTGLVTEMDKIGGPGAAGQFYRRDDWGKADQPSIWGQGVPSDLSKTLNWVVQGPDGVWGSDDDSDIEYIYLDAMAQSASPLLTAEQIRQAWLEHIYRDEDTPHRTKDGKPENFLWVSNQQAFDLMQQGLLPPLTGMLPWNPHYDMIDAQLTTELFGALAPARPDIALQLAYLPIRTTASGDAADIAQFYVVLHALAATVDSTQPLKPQVLAMAATARQYLPPDQYPARMFDFVMSRYVAGDSWEQARDAVYQRYQVQMQDNYRVSARHLYCNGCFAAGINFAASIVSLLYGAGDMQHTLQIATLAGWDSDNPAATWGGWYGLLLGRDGIERHFGQRFSSRFNIHRTRKGFHSADTPNGIDQFAAMASRGVAIIDRVVAQQIRGTTSPHCWQIPAPAPLRTPSL